MTRRVILFLILLIGVASAQSSNGIEPWNVPFSKDPARILTAARGIPAPQGEDVLVLLDEQQYSVDSLGRMTTTLRKVYRVLTADGAEQWSDVEQRYAPWYERRPELRARVLTADGAVHWLDNKTITDAPAAQFDASIFSDSRMLRAPLPAVAADSVVEFEIVVREAAPLLTAGLIHRIDVWDSMSVRRVHLVVDAAAGVPLKISSQLIPHDAIRRTESRSGVHVECDWGPIERKKDWEYSLPFDVVDHPVFEFATGRSWREVATVYGAIVNSRVGVKPTGLGEAPSPGETPKAIASRLVAALHKQVRYTGLELGDAAIVPNTPADVMARRYGDCKDKAALLVAALREAGLKADIALLLPGMGLDVNRDLPGFGLFSHAIVYVDATEPLWIDATAQYTRVGDLPAADQGRLALIATAATAELVKTPESASKVNRSVHTVEIYLADYGRSEIREFIETFGEAESAMRSRLGGADSARMKETLERQVKPLYLTDKLSDLTATRGDDFDQPFQLKLLTRNAGRANTVDDGAFAGLFSHFVFSDLPFGLTQLTADAEKEKDVKPRRHDFVLPHAYQAEYRYRVYYPSFLKPQPLPKSEEVKLGPATFSRNYRLDASGYLEAIFRFDSGKRRYSPAEYAAFRKELPRVWSEKPELISFPSATSEALALGKVREAVRIAREYSEKRSGSSSAHAGLSRVLIAAGAGDAARAAARKAVELNPESTQAWQALGWAYQHDSFGRRFRGNWNMAESQKALQKALELATEKSAPQMDLAILYEHNANGDRYGKGSRMDDAIAGYRSLLSNGPNAVVGQNLVVALLYANKYEEAEKELKTLPDNGIAPIVTALAQGADRAILDAQKAFPDPAIRASVFLNAAATVRTMRRYDLAVDLLKAAKRLSSAPELDTQLAAVSRFKRFDQVLHPADDPRSVVQRLYLAVLGGNLDVQHVRPFMTRREQFVDAPLTDKKVRRMLAGLRGRFRTFGWSGDALLDVFVSMLDLQKVGNDAFGYRIKGGTGLEAFPPAYVVKEDGQYRLLATADSAENVGKLVLEFLEANDLASARRWLDLVIAGTFVEPGNGTANVHLTDLSAGPIGDESPAAKFLWSGLTELGQTAVAARTAAASLIGTFSASEEAIRILKQSRKTATNKLDRGNIDLALCQAYDKAGKWTELLACAKDLSASFAVADKSFSYMTKARIALKQWAELEQDGQRELTKSPENSRVLRASASAMMWASKLDRAAEYIDRLEKLTFSGKEEHTLQAWYSLLAGKANDKLIEKLERDRGVENMMPDIDYAVGFLQALSGKTEEAQRSLTRALELDDFELLDARPWVLLGKIQEQYGNTIAAQSAYAEASKRPAADDASEWAMRLIPTPPKQ